MRSVLTSLAAGVAALLVAGGANALVWPDVPERMEHDLASTDVAVRVAAVERLDALGPSRATPLVLRALADADVNVRLAAAETATRAQTPGATAAVLSWFGEHDGRLRVAACDVAHAVPDARAVPLLARALSDADGLIRVRAIEALGVQGSADAVAPLLGKLDDPSPPVRIGLAHALARLRDPRAVVPLIGKVEDSVPEVREAVAQALGDLGDPRAAPAIALQLRDVSPEVRIVALAALAKVHGADTVDAVAQLATERNPAVRHGALATLGVLARGTGGSEGALKVLLGRLGADEDASADLDASPVRDAIVSAGGVAIAPLREILRGGASTGAMTSSAWVLGALGASAASSDLVGALRRGTLPPIAALHALASAGTPDELPVVLEFVGSENPAVREEALVAARALLDPDHPDGRAVEPLLAVAQARRLPPADLVRVIELLGRTGAARASATLQGFARSHSGGTGAKIAAIDALGVLGPTDADEPLLVLMADPAPEVRLHAADALSATGGVRARDALLHTLRGGTEVDRAAALTALRGILTRAPSDAAFEQLRASLSVVVGAERDAVLLALGRAAPVRSMVSDLLAGAKEADDRRTLLAACAGRPDSMVDVRAHLGHSDMSVRAEAAWSLGSSGGAEVLHDLDLAARDRRPQGVAVSIDATGSIARIAQRTHAPQATAMLCGLVGETHAPPLVRANALVGLSLVGARCGNGDVERAALADRSNSVRAGAARAIARTPRGPEDEAALARCASGDHSPEIAHLCQSTPVPGPAHVSPREHEVLVYVEGPSRSEPVALVPFVVELGDGLVRAGTADRRGAFFEPHAPAGLLRLHNPSSSQP